MYDLRNNDLVITNSNIKEKILLNITESKKIISIKIMTLKDFKNKFFGYYDERAIYYLMKKYNYKYNVAIKCLENVNFNKELKDELLNNNLLYIDKKIMKNIKRIVVINEDFIDPYIKDIFKNYETIYFNDNKNDYEHVVYEFNNIDDEVSFNAVQIIETLKKTDINNIYLVNVTDEYYEPIKRIFKLFNIPIEIDIKRNVFSSLFVQNFLKELKSTFSFEKALEQIKNIEIYNYILNICNKYTFNDVDEIIIDCIENEIKNNPLITKKYKKGIKIIDIGQINNDESYYFILGFNETIIPKIYKDEDFLSDKRKEELGILTSALKNKLERKKVIEKIKNYPNISISYKLKNPFEVYYPSSLISEYSLEVKRNNKINYEYSNLYNKIILTKMLDKLVKYNDKDSNLDLLYSNYSDLPYLKYDNKFTGINKNNFLKFIDNKLLLSYSSLDNYYHCSFKYYIKNILKLDPYEEQFMAFVGSLFHYVLSLSFNDNFDFETEFNNYISSKEMSNKEKFFLDKLKEDLKFIIETIKEQNNYSELKEELYEQKIFINKDKNIKITFMGIIDKLKYGSVDGKNVMAIIDYKTGSPNININNILYGLDMQLPVYIYLIKNSKYKNYDIAGFYLQKILPPKTVFDINNDENEDKKKNIRLEGYSNSNTDILEKFDTTYDNSLLIKSMKMSSKGFYSYAKVISDEEIDAIVKMVDKKIDEASSNIENAKFEINPKQIDFELKGCEYCTYKDLCYRTEKDIIKLRSKNLDLLGGEDIA